MQLGADFLKKPAPNCLINKKIIVRFEFALKGTPCF